MNVDPTSTTSWDYLVELSDDGKEPDQQEPEVLILPPVAHPTDAPPAPDSSPEQGAQT
jgi:hypothetical protein